VVDPAGLDSLLADQLRDGDVLITQGAGDIGALARRLRAGGGDRP
jgi:UDP-N-acetylmuramate--alanine ligase